MIDVGWWEPMTDKEWEHETSRARRLEAHEPVLLGDFHRGCMGQKSPASGYELGQPAGDKGWYRPNHTPQEALG